MSENQLRNEARPNATASEQRNSRPKLGQLKLRLPAEQRRRLRKIGGLSLLIFSAYLVLACLSHFATGPADQSAMGNGMGPGLTGEPADNIAGALGAYFARLLITQGWGVIGLTLPLFMGFLGLAILLQRWGRWIRPAFIGLFFALHWFAMAFDLINRLRAEPSRYLGGDTGQYLNDSLGYYIGEIGVFLLLLLVMAAFLLFYTNLRIAGLVQAVAWLRTRSFKQPLQFSRRRRPAAGAEGNQPRNEPRPGDAPGPEPAAAHDPASEASGQELFYTVAETEKPVNGGPLVRQNGNGNSEPATAGNATYGVPNASDSSHSPEAQQPAASSQHSPPNVSPAAPPSPAEPQPLNEGETLTLAAEEAAPAASAQRSEPGPQADDDLELVIEPGAEETPLAEQQDVLSYATNVQPAEDEAAEYVRYEAPEDQASLSDPEHVGELEVYDPTKTLSRYAYPTLELLTPHDDGGALHINKEELTRNKDKIIETLRNFKIEISSIKATIGPTVTLYQLVPAPGVQISKIRNRAEDIALNLAAPGIRIIAPMPNQGTVGIEIPNSKSQTVSFRSVIGTEKFLHTEAGLPLAIGKSIEGHVYIADLTKLPHLLVAGATGQGKSVGLNCIIASILYKKHPAQIKFVLIDPKKVELSIYQRLEYHFLAMLPDCEESVITENEDALRTLKSLVYEMELRYDLLKTAQVRNLDEYNDKFANRKLNPDNGHRYLPYIVTIIDELADLKSTMGKEIEDPINRLAAKARAVGIHLIAATQRPSTDVITGTIKNNFTARMAYRVQSQVDSRTVLDIKGAEQLVGKGDMLYKGDMEPIRLQTPFLTLEEVEELVATIARQQAYPEPYYLPEPPEESENEGGRQIEGEMDPHFPDAARLIVRNQQGSTSLIQRRMGLGYNRAGRIMDQLEMAGVVGQNRGSKPREILMDELQLEQYLSQLS